VPTARAGRRSRTRGQTRTGREAAGETSRAELTSGRPGRDHPSDVEDYELIAQELSDLGEKIRRLDERLAEVERVNARLEDAALTTARALGEISRHWDAVYEAMRRAEINMEK
jgi:sugar-specific transcriptional regulator TrmB